MERFWQMFVVDALLGNFDRHNGNWGFLVDENTGESIHAPVFDCGSCLLPQADGNIMQKCLDDENEMNARIFTFPASMLKINGRKINYYDFLHSSDKPQDLTDALMQLSPKIANLNIKSLINDMPYITTLQQDFYLSHLEKRRQILFDIE